MTHQSKENAILECKFMQKTMVNHFCSTIYMKIHHLNLEALGKEKKHS